MMVVLALLSLVLGVVYGLSGADWSLLTTLSNHTDLILYALMFFVGISIGMHGGLLRKFKEYHIKIFIIPFGIIVGSIIGGIVCALLCGYSAASGAMIASGLGWYSLSGVTISNLAGAQMGSIAFLSNLMREMVSFILIPPISRHLNDYTCIAPAAATSEDTTLAMMMRYTNEESVMLSVFNGVICSAAVPLLISLFSSFIA